MIIPQDNIYSCHVYIYKPKYWQYSFTDICEACIYVNEHIVKSFCGHVITELL